MIFTVYLFVQLYLAVLGVCCCLFRLSVRHFHCHIEIMYTIRCCRDWHVGAASDDSIITITIIIKVEIIMIIKVLMLMMLRMLGTLLQLFHNTLFIFKCQHLQQHQQHPNMRCCEIHSRCIVCSTPTASLSLGKRSAASFGAKAELVGLSMALRLKTILLHCQWNVFRCDFLSKLFK